MWPGTVLEWPFGDVVLGLFRIRNMIAGSVKINVLCDRGESTRYMRRRMLLMTSVSDPFAWGCENECPRSRRGSCYQQVTKNGILKGPGHFAIDRELEREVG